MSQQSDQLVAESVELLQQFKSNLLPCVYSVKNLLTKLKNGELPVHDGISLFDLKNKLFTSYLIDLVQVTNAKINGKSLPGNPALERLVEERIVLEKIRPIEHKLKYQVDQLMRVLNTGTIDQSDPMNLKPDLSNIANDGDQGEDEELDLDDPDHAPADAANGVGDSRTSKSGVYVPPRLAQMKFEDEGDRKVKALERAKKHAINSSIIKELRREFDDAPEEEYDSLLHHQKSGIGKFLKQKKRFEEDNFIRLNLTKKQKSQARKMTTVNSIGDDVTRFEDISALNIQNPNDFTPQKRRKTKPAFKKNKKKSIKRRKH